MFHWALCFLVTLTCVSGDERKCLLTDSELSQFRYVTKYPDATVYGTRSVLVPCLEHSNAVWNALYTVTQLHHELFERRWAESESNRLVKLYNGQLRNVDKEILKLKEHFENWQAVKPIIKRPESKLRTDLNEANVRQLLASKKEDNQRLWIANMYGKPAGSYQTSHPKLNELIATIQSSVQTTFYRGSDIAEMASGISDPVTASKSLKFLSDHLDKFGNDLHDKLRFRLAGAADKVKTLAAKCHHISDFRKQRIEALAVHLVQQTKTLLEDMLKREEFGELDSVLMYLTCDQMKDVGQAITKVTDYDQLVELKKTLVYLENDNKVCAYTEIVRRHLKLFATVITAFLVQKYGEKPAQEMPPNYEQLRLALPSSLNTVPLCKGKFKILHETLCVDVDRNDLIMDTKPSSSSCKLGIESDGQWVSFKNPSSENDLRLPNADGLSQSKEWEFEVTDDERVLLKSYHQNYLQVNKNGQVYKLVLGSDGNIFTGMFSIVCFSDACDEDDDAEPNQ